MSFDSLSEFRAPIRDGSVNTELIDGKWCVVMTLQLWVPRCDISIISHHLCFSEVAWKVTRSSEYWMPTFAANNIIISSATLSHEPPFTIERDMPFSSNPSLRNDQCPLGKTSAYSATLEELRLQIASLSFVVPVEVVVHQHEDDAFLEIFRQSFEFFLQHVLNFMEELQRGASWESVPLEHDWFSVNPVRLTTRRIVSKSLEFVRTRSYLRWIICNLPKAQHRIGKTNTFPDSVA